MEETKKEYVRLENILSNISEIQTYELTEDKKDELISELEYFYEKNQRHQYSDIAKYIYSNQNDLDEYLMSNLIELYVHCKNPNTKSKIFKIIDHIKLETIRLQFLEGNNKRQIYQNMLNMENTLGRPFKKFTNEFYTFKEEMNGINEVVDTLGDKVERSESKLNNFNMQSITILGIFSGIVMAFFGGMSFFNEVLSNIDKVSIYRLSFITLLIGFILFNVFFFFMYYIARLVDKPIRNECIDENCNKCNKKCNLFKKLKKLYPISFYMNSFFASALFIVFMSWLFK